MLRLTETTPVMDWVKFQVVTDEEQTTREPNAITTSSLLSSARRLGYGGNATPPAAVEVEYAAVMS